MPARHLDEVLPLVGLQQRQFHRHGEKRPDPWRDEVDAHCAKREGHGEDRQGVGEGGWGEAGPAGDGEWLPEWNPKSHRVEPRRVRTQPLQARDAMPWRAPPALHAHAARVRQRLQQQRAAPRWQHGCADGEAIDIDAWVLAQAEPGHRGDTGGPSGPQGQTGATADRLYQRRVRDRHDLASLLLADLSLSTDAHVDDDQRVIDVVRDSLYVFGEALAGSGDAFSMVGFSSLRRSLRLHELKGFDERWAAPALARIGAVKPGYYTRMGAALRAGTRRLALRPERQRLLLLLTDGKPHDLDGYEGRWGLEDTRQAVVEARRAGVLPFALSIDAQAGDVMPRLFGPGGWAWRYGSWLGRPRADGRPG